MGVVQNGGTPNDFRLDKLGANTPWSNLVCFPTVLDWGIDPGTALAFKKKNQMGFEEIKE